MLNNESLAETEGESLNLLFEKLAECEQQLRHVESHIEGPTP